jgi:hypothetical protein
MLYNVALSGVLHRYWTSNHLVKMLISGSTQLTGQNLTSQVIRVSITHAKLELS